MNPLAQRNRLVLIGTYTDGSSRGIHALRFDEVSGHFTSVDLAVETPSPSFLVTRADGRVVFAVNEISTYQGASSGSVSSFAVDGVSGRLTPLSVQPTRGADPCHLALDATGRHLAVANYSGGSFVLLPIRDDGRIDPISATFRRAGSGPHRSRQEGPHAHMVAFDVENRFLLGVDLGVDRVLVRRFDPAAADMLAEHVEVSMPPGSGPRHLAFHPVEPLLFVINELTSTVSSLVWDNRFGHLTPHGEVSTLPPDFTGTSTTAELAIHPDGRFLYASNRGHDTIAVFGVSSDGQLVLIEHVLTRGRTPRHFTIDRTGRWLVAANQQSDTLAVFAIDEVTGRLSPHGPLTEVASPVCVLFMP